MPLSEDPDVRRLQNDRATTGAMISALFAVVPALIGITFILAPGPQFEARSNPLYWLVLALPLPWSWKLMDYSPGALRLVRPVLFAAPFLAGLAALWARIDRQDMEPYRWAIVATILLSLAGGLFFNRSILCREGAGGP